MKDLLILKEIKKPTKKRQREAAKVLLLALAAGAVLAGPAAGQSSAWYNPAPDMAQTISPVSRGRLLLGVPVPVSYCGLRSCPPGVPGRLTLGVACVGAAPVVMYSMAGPLADTIAGKAGLSAGTDEVHLAFRFDGRGPSEVVLKGFRVVAPGEISIAVSETATLIPALKSAGFAATGAPGGGWESWSLARAAAAIDRLPCWWEGPR